MIDRIPRPASHLSSTSSGGSRVASRQRATLGSSCPLFSRVVYRLCLFVLIFVGLSFQGALAQEATVGTNCCLPENSSIGGCTEEGTPFEGVMYMCVPVNTNDCKYCNNDPGKREAPSFFMLLMSTLTFHCA